jgi:hypothetical protein
VLFRSFYKLERHLVTTHEAFEKARKEHLSHLTAIVNEFTQAYKASTLNRHRQLRSLAITSARILHLLRKTIHAYQDAARASGIDTWLHYKANWGIDKALGHKYSSTLISIYTFTHAQKIPLDRWFKAQFDTLGQRVRTLTPYVCYGHNAYKRYLDWEAKQSQRYASHREKDKAITSPEKAIIRSIRDSHRHALTWYSVLKQLQPPNIAAVLAFLYPHVSSWYVLSYQEFREQVMEPHVLVGDLLEKRWGKWKRSPKIQQLCKETLERVIETYGKLEFK